ncbi:MAG: pyrimidine 5'-nucleotidase [Deferrisomatales bacterium]
MTRVWVLDVDNTMYPAGSGLFARVDERICRFMEERVGLPPGDVPALRRRYRDEYGVTLGGLMAHHGVDPGEYLPYVHDVPLGEYLAPDPALAAALAGLPGPRVAFTNGSEAHARAVMARLGVGALVERVFDLAFMDYVPKPRPHGYRKLLAALGVAAARCCLVDDLPENLDTARELGMATVLVGPEPRPPHARVAHLQELAALAPDLCGAGGDGRG